MPERNPHSSVADGSSAIAPITLRNRAFYPQDLRTIQAIVESSPAAHRFELSKRICVALGWHQVNGRLKDRSCRDVLQKLEDMGFLRLPERRREPVRRRPIRLTHETAVRAPVVLRPRELHRDGFSIVTAAGDRGQEKLWNEYVERYHELGYGVSLGAHIKYIVRWKGEPISCIAFGGAAWKLEARDHWIGWSRERREANLHLVVNNTRFLILPWARIENLASRILALAAKRLSGDWLSLYGYRPLLLETFVDAQRHAGTCYRAANWICVGPTKGRGRMDRHFRADQPKKLILLYPLVAEARDLLRGH
jgi:hypothetical protein